MQISGYGAIGQTQWPYDQQRRTRSTSERSPSRGDTVNFSDEALELLARMQAAKAEAVKAGDAQAESSAAAQDKEDAADGSSASSRSTSSTSSTSGPGTAVSMAASSENTSGGGGFGETAGEQAEDKAASSAVHEKNQQPATETDIDTKIKSLKGQIEQIARQIGQIYAMPIEPQQKEAMAKPLEDRIEQLEQEIAALEAQKNASAESGGEAQG